MELRFLSVATVTLLSAAIIAGGCAQSGITTQPLSDVTRIELTDNMSRSPKVISDPTQIKSIVEFANSYRTKWAKPFPETPIPVFVANFYDGSKFLGHFGAGKTFFETQCQDDFCSQKVSESEIKEFLRITGESEAVLERP